MKSSIKEKDLNNSKKDFKNKMADYYKNYITPKINGCKSCGD